ncbi:MAG: asparagine synthase (glutamine-hydrolyzing) [Methanobacteriaceae archaeon]|nr:asparagine synthase (glutamine-hydrolyzing) [Methanobacteriaceae archaeon]
MCAIVGLIGDDISKELYQMLKILKHRGPDGSGVLVDKKVIYGDLEELEVPKGNLGLGHNLLSIVGKEGLQPIRRGNLVLVSNGEIYNYQELKEDLKDNCITDSDCEVILNLICKFYKSSLADAVKKAVEFLDGDYAFAVYDGKDLVLARDPVGVKPLYYGENYPQKIFGFASERKALWNIGIKDVKTLEPNKILVNHKLIDSDHGLENIINKKGKLSSKINPEQVYKIEDIKAKLKNGLIDSVEKRIRGLDKVGIIFSGGVDSTIIARIAVDLGIKPILYSVGQEDSVDLKFSKKAAKWLGLPLKCHLIDENVVRQNLHGVLDAIEEYNIMKIGVGMTAYLASKMAHEDGLKVVLSGQGADELFGGYHRYLDLFNNKGEDAHDDLKKDVLNLYHVNLERDDAACMAHSVELRVPYLDMEIINMAMNIPMKYKIKDGKDPLRKCILRRVASDLKIPPEIVYRPKKAAQYGSGIHKILIKKILKKKDYSKFLDEKYK